MLWKSKSTCCILLIFLSMPGGAQSAESDALNLVFCCDPSNDLYAVTKNCGLPVQRFDEIEKAIANASTGAGVLILADSYPADTTMISPATYREAQKKGLRLYVEYPATLPQMQISEPRRTRLERAVVASNAFGPSLNKLRILAIHDCHFVPVQQDNAHIVVARVAGFDTAVFGLEGTPNHPILFEHSYGNVLVATTKLSQFVTARYAPKDAWQAIWRMILSWLQPGAKIPDLDWSLTVRPTYDRDVPLPQDTVKKAIVRGIDWHSRAKMLMHESWEDKYYQGPRIDPLDLTGPGAGGEWPVGDGECGVLEGYSSRIQYDGSQPICWNLRTDSIGESSLAFALRSMIDGDERSRRIAANLLDWVYFKSHLFQNDPKKANFGLLHWGPNSAALYHENDIKAILGCMGTAALLEIDRWDEVLVANILGNFRTTGVHGFRGYRLENEDLLKNGWEYYWRSEKVLYAPHYEVWIWSAYLWLYDKTGYPPLLERTRNAIHMMMEAYPDEWRWTNGIQQERGRMLLTLAWLIRIDDQPRYREWLRRIAADMEKCQDVSGAIREELGVLDNGRYRPPQSNSEYGEHEASLIQENGDPVADMLYTCNFTFLGLHEAFAATGEKQYLRMADKLAEFFVRIQVRSDAHPELDGGWFRAFDYERWDYWGSNADAGWGAWSIEVGWTQAWIPTVLAMRELGQNLWDLTQDTKVGRHWEKYRELMLPKSAIEDLNGNPE
ncbi:MAG: hypothetical protein ABIH23_35795 [bacterium]